ncbi:MAG: 23S rRNA (uracil(1939)-C(5))-methyltransferase RlmD [Clostridiales bacterium]|nr:23S rRNA (uracil(1939)-C(5))-methyltransferase RlmD [Roseburia sp.]MDD7636002.1 23S rRNA (uracil(1939)-C(5))-methyltransferase RlmD [Clostridiales bacterium]MDY4114140.1 23S rRNA (uracil(1939)-C(5))-methyltransferase RlmD [Roseburia sp.]
MTEKKTNYKKRAVNVEDACPYAKKCGGCDYQGTAYEKQLKEKQELVQKYVGGFCKVRPIIGMENPYHYRNKVHAVFDIAKGGAIISGVYKAGTHDVVSIDECRIEDEISDAIIRDIRGLLRSFKIKTYDEDTGYGLLRHVLVRRGFHSGEVMVVLVLGSPILPSKNNFVKALRKLHPEITTVVINVNNKKTSMVLGDKETVIYGKGYIEDTLCGRTFRISPKSFYQVNPVQTEHLYGKAIEYAKLTGKEKVVDAYCGIGTIGLIAADKAMEVISVELNKDAVRDAITNAKRNQIKNVQFYNADAGKFMVEMSEQGADVDVVFMDPPRAGSDEAFLSSVVKLAPKRVVYVSCNPETLARDLKYLTKHGYRAEECTPVDMFPWTKHCEVVCTLRK